ncbi:MAG: M16 family metallopeptidase [Pseudolabrys sp.]
MSARKVLTTLAAGAALALAVLPAQAVEIQRVVSPSGIVAWLVQDASSPLVAMNFSFHGGASQDSPDKSGAASLAASLLDEGAGDLDGKTFHQRLENRAIELNFSVSRDYFYGTLRTLNENRDEAVELLKLALTAPRFDADALERARSQVLSGLRRDTTSPNSLASQRWWETAFPNHPYGRSSRGTLQTVPGIAAADLHGYVKRVFARNELIIGIVGDIDARAAGLMIDRVFASLPAKNNLVAVAATKPQGLGKRIVIDVDVPQAVVTFGGMGIPRSDPDFMAGYIVNHILGGGSFSSRLYREVREKRGLAYGVSDSLIWFRRAAVVVGGTATRADRTREAISVIETEIKRMADEGPTPEELAKAKSYLKGAYALSLDTSSKIAAQLVQIQADNLGIDYIKRRSALIDAVTVADAKRAAKRIFGDGLLVTVAGRPVGVSSSEANPSEVGATSGGQAN